MPGDSLLEYHFEHLASPFAILCMSKMSVQCAKTAIDPNLIEVAPRVEAISKAWRSCASPPPDSRSHKPVAVAAVRGNKMLQTSDWKPLTSKTTASSQGCLQHLQVADSGDLRRRPSLPCAGFKNSWRLGRSPLPPRHCAAWDCVPVV